MDLPLSEIIPGKLYRIKYIKHNIMRQRLLEIGLFDDTEIEVIRKAPFNDPVEYKIGNFYVGLRKAEASQIVVEPVI